jgi:hypothetical protein
MSFRMVLSILVCLNLLRCTAESVDLTGKWEGTANMVVDGVQKTSPLKLELTHQGSDIHGAVLWGDHRRDVTAASMNGSEIDIESATAQDHFRMRGLLRNETLQGRFWIHYPLDPEPFPGNFKVERKR